MTQYVIPLTAEPQTFAITLAARQYTLTFRWSSAAEGGWLMDIADTESAVSLVAGIPLVTGADLLAPYPDLGIGGMLWLYAIDDLPPGYGDLGTTVQVIFETED